jgi:hypothetical protein
MWLGALALVMMFAWLVSTRANELCVVALSNEGARLVRGKAPRAFLSEAADVARRANIDGVRIRVVVESQLPRLVPSASLSDDVTQQLRNVVGRYNVGQFRLGSAKR